MTTFDPIDVRSRRTVYVDGHGLVILTEAEADAIAAEVNTLRQLAYDVARGQQSAAEVVESLKDARPIVVTS